MRSFALLALTPGLAVAAAPYATPVAVDTINNPAELEAGDFDGDGDLDLVVASAFRLLTNDGAGNFAATTIPGGGGPSKYEVVDLDRDGDLDIVAAYFSQGEVAWIRNDGAAWTFHPIASGMTRVTDVRAGDLDGDGDIDVAAVAWLVDEVRMFENADGVGGAWSSTLIDGTLADPQRMSLADVDADGDLDITVTALTSDLARWYANDGSGGTWTPQNIATSIDGPGAIEWDDLDGDGDLDAVVAVMTDGELRWYENVGGGSAWTSHLVGAMNSPNRVAIHDADLDGDLDIAVTSAFGDETRVYDNLGGATAWAHSVVDTPDFPSGIVAGDFDGDGDEELVTTSLNDDDVVLLDNLLAHRSVTSLDDVRAYFRDETARDMSSADVDGDGDIDVLLADADGLRLLSNTGAGSFTTTTLHSTGNWLAGIADLDGDGDLDLIGAHNAGVVYWYPNTGGATWTRTILLSMGTGPRGIATGDLDGDGDIDLGITTVTGDVANIYLNNGSASFSQLVSLQGDSPQGLDFGDIDGDGDLDVIVAQSGTARRFRWFANDLDGAGVWPATDAATNIQSASGIRLHDLDGDGDLDGVGTNWGGMWVLTNTGGGVFSSASIATISGTWADAADMDLDGDMDLFAATNGGGLTVWTNEGGAYTPGVTNGYTSFASVWAGAVFDADGDGDPDVLTGHNGGTFLGGSGAGGPRLSTNHLHAAELGANSFVPPVVGPTPASLLVLDVEVEGLGRVADTNLEMVGLGLQFMIAGAPATQAQLQGLFASLSVYLDDDGDGAVTPGVDPQLASDSSFAVDASGTLALPLTLGIVGAVDLENIFVVLDTQATAPLQGIEEVAVEHAVAHGTVMETEDLGIAVDVLETATATAVVAIDTAPTAILDGPYSANEGATVAVSSAGSVDDGAIVSFDWDCDGDGTFDASGATATCSWADEGTYTVTLEVADDGGNVVQATSTAEVFNVAPTITTSADPTALEGSTWTYAAAAADPGADALTWTLTSAPAGMAVDATGAVSWTPTYADVGAYTFDLGVDDGDGGTDAQTIALTVDFLDVDADGMPDTWEASVGLDPTVDDAALDADADGLSNLDEFLGGGDPSSYDGPGAPTATWPVGGEEARDAAPVLLWDAAQDPDGDALTYEVEVYDDDAMTTLLASASGISAEAWAVDVALPENHDAHWRVRALDPHVAGAWTELEAFFFNAVQEAPGAPTAASPLDGDTVDTARPQLAWTEALDADRDPITYDVVVRAGAVVVDEAQGVDALSWAVTVELAEDTLHTWQLRAADDSGRFSDWTERVAFVVDTNNGAPDAIAWTSPVDGQQLETASPVLRVSESHDPEGLELEYVFEIDTAQTFDSADLVQLVADAPTVDLAALGVELPANVDLHLRARAEDPGGAASPWATITVQRPVEAPPEDDDEGGCKASVAGPGFSPLALLLLLRRRRS